MKLLNKFNIGIITLALAAQMNSCNNNQDTSNITKYKINDADVVEIRHYVGHIPGEDVLSLTLRVTQNNDTAIEINYQMSNISAKYTNMNNGSTLVDRFQIVGKTDVGDYAAENMIREDAKILGHQYVKQIFYDADESYRTLTNLLLNGKETKNNKSNTI